ncbi:leucine-rich repeat and IQ domain-containing protein 1 isoform X2 [Heptranchias perlo]|uniref:leucine-rich repeat and IQ domain-containing protein 1 isoform X2 n=1 Tax=Heptranchias perlo TaxID=212740 RepID=UPI003559F8C9
MAENKLLEEAIEAELSKISISPSEMEELEEQSEEEILLEPDYDSDDLPESVLCCLERMKQRGENVEKLILQDLEQPEYAVYTIRGYSGLEMFTELATEFGEEPLNLKERILAQIEDEEQREQTHIEPQKNISPSFQVEAANRPVGDETISDDDAITCECKEVEERCWLTLQHWEIEEKELQKTKLAELMEQREREKKQVEEAEERAKSRQRQFEEKLEKLTEERKQQQAELEKKIRLDQEALEQELKHHEEIIHSMQIKMDKERRVFEDEQAKQRKRVKKLQYRAATTIQARFRAHMVHKKYAPILKERLDERKRKKDLQLRMEQERRDFEEKIKRKLEERKRSEEEEGRKQEEAKRLQREEQKQRQIEYEKKKEQERQRLEKERQLKLEELQKLQQEEKRKELQKKKKEEKLQEAERKKTEESKLLEERNRKEGLKQREEKKIEKEDDLRLIEEGNINPNITKNKEPKQDENSSENVYVPMNENTCLPHNIQKNSTLINDNGVVGQCTVEMATDTKLEMKLPAGEVVKSTAENTLSIEFSVTIPKNINLLQTVSLCAVTDRLPGRQSGEGKSVLNTDDSKLHNEGLIDAHNITESVNLNLEGRSLAKGLTLPDHVEQKRLSWMKMCAPWSKISRENKRKKVKQRIRLRHNPVCRLPALSPEVILHSGVWASLQQVTTVTLQDLPSCSLSTLSQCLRLQSLTLRNCGLETLEGINNCKGLKYIDVQENNIQNIHCLELEDLCILLLSHNQITSMHGLEKCSNLRVLELSHNNITRIGGLESLKKLQRLVVDHNQLISTNGLSETPTLLYLDCSFNYLNSIEGIDNCGLLQNLKLQSNSLSELPRFGNHVLLRELYLDDNSISSLKVLSEYWLPMLQHLSISQNSLTHLTTMSDLLLLERLNVSNNRLSDLKSFLLCLNGCHGLLELLLDGNPFQQESGWRCSILKILPSLKVVDGERISSTDESCADRSSRPSPGSFLALCQAQLQDFELLLKRHETELDYAATVLQSYWRGYIIRRHIHMYMILHNAASVIQTAWRDYYDRMKVALRNSAWGPAKKWKIFDGSEERRHRAATIIQACWRGCLLRKKLSHALAAVQTEEEDDFEEVNLSEFTFDEATLDKDWITLDPQTSPQTLPIVNHYLQPKTPAHCTTDSFGLPRHLAQAWQGDDINTVEKCGNPSSSPATTSVSHSSRSHSRTVSRFSEATSYGKQNFRSEKEEKISEEWGFKDAHTAQLMLKRAQKMKSKKAEAKKLLDPIVRLALFKNKKNKYPPVKLSKKICDRVEYFRAPEEFIRQDTISAEKLQKSRELTYQWLHTQIANYELTNSRIMKNHHFLPQLDPEVLHGGRVQLMASPVGREGSDLDVVSVTSGSGINQPSDRFNYSHWHSTGSTKTTVPLKTIPKPLKQERISFRNSRVRLSTGWGSGKRRGKSF